MSFRTYSSIHCNEVELDKVGDLISHDDCFLRFDSMLYSSLIKHDLISTDPIRPLRKKA